MPDCLFYRAVRRSTDQILEQLVRKALGDNSRVVICSSNTDRLRRIDDRLWLFDDDAFIPHGLAGSGNDSRQTVLLATTPDNPNGAEILVCLGELALETSRIDGFSRTCVIFDGGNPAELAAARANWKRVVDAGWSSAYWSDESGKWQCVHESPGRASDDHLTED